MFRPRVIPVLLLQNLGLVKTVKFNKPRYIGDPINAVKIFNDLKADELVFLDITATKEDRKTFAKLVDEISENINIPFTVGGGIKTAEDVDTLLKSGADKVSINSYAVKNPDFINELATNFGTQCIVVAIDAKYVDNDWFVYLVGGRVKTEIRLFDWAKEVEDRGAGEILFTSMDHDGTKNGFACQALEKLSQIVNIPIIASGGAGKIEHFNEVFKSGNIDAALAASVFHFNEIRLKDLKTELKNNNIPIRL